MGRCPRLSSAVIAGATLSIWLNTILPGATRAESTVDLLLPQASHIQQVKDLLTEELPGDVMYPGDVWVEFVEVGEVVLFRGWDGIHGFELWRTDGTTEGTELFMDLCPGECSSFPSELRLMMGYVYFHATTADRGNTIWRTDGTPQGTELIVDISPGNGHFISTTFGAPFFAEFQDSIFFVADDGISGVELWRTDGQPGGLTELIADIRPGPKSSWPSNLFVVGETLFMAADDGVSGMELWKSDGTSAGTTMVEDLCPGPDDCLDYWSVAPPAGPKIFARTGDKLIFIAREAYDRKLWISDGTPSGTMQLGNLEVDRLFPFPALDGSVLLSAEVAFEGPELWRTDGTEAGTYRVKEINPSLTRGSYPSAWGTSDGIVYLSADDGTHGQELWRTDGTEAGTSMVTDIRPGIDSSFGSAFYSLVPLPTSNVVYFPANDGQQGTELWSSDGSSGGTTLLADANPGPDSGFDSWSIQFPAELDDRLIFFAHNSIRRSGLWVTDGSPGGTEFLRQINHQTSSMLRLSWPVAEPNIAAARETVLYRADDGKTGIELFGSDGTDAGTNLVKDLCTEDCTFDSRRGPQHLTTVGESVFFVAPMENDWQLWVSDGTTEGTRIVDPSLPQAWYFELTPWVTRDGPPRLLFTRAGDIFVSDGSPQGTYALGDGEWPWSPAPAEDRVFFACGALCISYGNPGDAQAIPGSSDSRPQRLTALGKRVVYSADDGVAGREMWISDGTQAGTYLLRDINPGPASSVTRDRWGGMTLAAADLVYFPADDGVTGEELWQTDGTPQGTVPVADLGPGPLSSEPRPWVYSDSTLFFTAWTPTEGRELWRLDKRSGGLHLVADLNPGPGSGITERLFEAFWPRSQERPLFWNGRLYFAGSDGVHGVELWSTDGTAWGTRLEMDIHPGPGSSSPSGFTPWEDELFFSATDGSTGWELWKLELQPSGVAIFEDDFESGDTSEWSDTESPPVSTRPLPR